MLRYPIGVVHLSLAVSPFKIYIELINPNFRNVCTNRAENVTKSRLALATLINLINNS